jgi:hypothetical protein
VVIIRIIIKKYYYRQHWHYAPALSRFKPVRYTIGSYCSDLASLILQGAGGALDSTAET